MKKLSIIVPVYFNEENLKPLYEDLKKKVLSKLEYDYEIVMVDDGSKDNSYKVMKELQQKDNKIVLVKLARNFGEHAALLAGLSKCTGDCAVRKAADIQEPSEMILEMLEKYEQGNKVVLALRESRQDKWHEKLLSNVYTEAVKHLALKNMPKGGVDTFLVDRQVIDLLVNLNQSNLPITEQILWIGYDFATVYYKRQKRTIGKSRWTLSKKIKMTFDSILGFSYLPIRFISTIGILSCVMSFVWIVCLVIEKLTQKITIDGYTSIVAIILMAFGIIMFSIGIIGEYLWRTFDVSRRMPPFIIDEVKQSEKQK